jgi:DNA-binding NarL/FixJ family response regulator
MLRERGIAHVRGRDAWGEIVSKTTDVFLLAENRLLREALIRLLRKKNEVRIVGASAYSPQVEQEIADANPQIILLDSNSLNFSRAGLIPTLRTVIRDVRLVMVDMDPDEDTFLRAVGSGVVGYVLKDASALEVAATIRAVAGGLAVCPPTLSMALFHCVEQQRPTGVVSSWGADFGLSRREQEMVEFLRQRLTNKEIAARLNLSEQTVKNHVHHILRKVGAQNRSTVVARCQRERNEPNAIVQSDA